MAINMELHFTKMTGAGNDFVVLDNRGGQIFLDRTAIRLICDRYRGVGADGLLLVERSDGRGDYRMRYYNADGGEAEMCGNGARCFAKFVQRLGAHGKEVTFETGAGLVLAQFEEDGEVSLRMGRPHDRRGPDLLEAGGRQWEVYFLNTGVPHAVCFVEDFGSVDVVGVGRELRNHPAFKPAGTNVNFVQVLGRGLLRVRTYERGVEDETLACGTGVTAAVLIFAGIKGVASPVAVETKGGDILKVRFDDVGENVELIGPAEFVFEGRMKF